VQCDSVDDSYPALLEPNFGETADAFRYPPKNTQTPEIQASYEPEASCSGPEMPLRIILQTKIRDSLPKIWNRHRRRARCKEAISRIYTEHKGETVLVVTHAAVIEAAIQALVPGTVVPEVGDGAMTELREIGEGMEDGEGQVGGWGIVGNVCEVGYLGENYGKLEHILNEEDG
jgi:hypothetical protein